MTIQKETLEKWKALRSQGDFKKIAAEADMSPETISLAFRNEECSDETFEAIAAFYERKIERLSQYLPNIPAPIVN